MNCTLGRCKMTLKKFVYLIAFGVLALSAFPVFAAVQVGEAAPDFTGTDANGETFKLSDQLGKKVILEWTNAKCPFVIKHYDSGNMQMTQEKATMDPDVVWVTINSGGEGKQGHLSAEEAKQYIKESGSHANSYILDASGEIGHLYEAKTTPHMFIINEQGMLVYKGAIDSDSSPRQSAIEGAKNYVLSALDEMKAGKAITDADTMPYGCAVKYAK